MEKAAALFVQGLRERNASAHTVRAYTRDLAEFAAHVGKNRKPEAVDHVHIRGFLSELYGRGLTKSSVARSLAAVRSVYKWLAREGLAKRNPAALVSTPKLPKKLPRVPTAEEINAVLDSDMPEHAAFTERDRLLLE